jgi:hypothetical protein
MGEEMTKVEIRPGACGFSVIVTATEASPRKIRLTIETECEHVKEWSGGIEFLAIKDIYGHPFTEDAVYRAAKKAIRHASCPVPCGIIKTAEAELGLAVKKDVLIHFFDGS